MMSAEPLNLEELVQSIADGRPLDWVALELTSDPAERRLLRHLRVVSGVAEVHRTVRLEALAETIGGVATEPRLSLSRWGHLLLIEKIGEGAFGDVYRARDPWLDREVALKLLKADVADGDPAQRIVDEARALARVRDGNVVTVHGADRHDGRVGLWMELVRGRTLAELLATQGPFSATEAAAIGQEVCQALASVHTAGLIHRDVKAQNVMREAGGRVVLMDFGAGGTPLYLAPELFAGRTPSVASDLYSVAVLLFHLVTGRYPINGKSVADLEDAHLRGTRTPLAEVRPDVPATFAAIVERGLHPDPTKRFASAREMQEALRSVAPPGQVTAGPTAPRATRRWPSLVTIAAALALLVGGGAATWRYFAPGGFGRGSGDKWIAVIPFRAIGPNPETIYYSEGLSEDLTAQLARLGSVRVVSGMSVRQFRGTDKTPTEIGRALNVTALITGSVRLEDDQLLIVVEVIDAEKSEQLWSATFNRPRGDALLVQREVVRQASMALTGSFSAADASRLQRREPDPQAFDLYLKGRYYWNTRSPEGITRSIGYFSEATAVDPNAALPFAGLADAYMLAGFYNVVSPSVAHVKAEEAALRAIELEPDLAEGHAALGSLRLDQFRWSEAEASLKRAIDLNPSYASAHHWYGLLLTAHGRFDEALQSLRNAQAADPSSHALEAATAYVHYVSRAFPMALQGYQQILDVAPTDFLANGGIVETYAAMGDLPAARRAVDNAARVTGRGDDLRVTGAYVYALAGDSKAAVELLSRVYANTNGKPIGHAEIASVYAALGDLTRAFESLERAAVERDPLLGYIAVDPRFDRLRLDGRFSLFLNRLGLSPK
jgi:eukaryotic-like serine/threonine-protein kinase